MPRHTEVWEIQPYMLYQALIFLIFYPASWGNTVVLHNLGRSFKLLSRSHHKSVKLPPGVWPRYFVVFFQGTSMCDIESYWPVIVVLQVCPLTDSITREPARNVIFLLFLLSCLSLILLQAVTTLITSKISGISQMQTWGISLHNIFGM